MRIDDDLLSDLKRRAQAEQLSLTELINRLLRIGIEAASAPSRRRRFRQKTFSMGEPRADLNKTLKMAAELEDEEIVRKLAMRK